MLCKRVLPIVNGLKKEYASKLDFVVRPHNEDDAPDLIAKYELDVHGIVVTDQAGKLRWSSSGHDQTEAEIRAGIEQALAR